MFHLKQFILSKVTADNDKIPCNISGVPINAQDAANWMDYETATKLAKQYGLRVAFVLSDADPYFCVDIDHCALPDGSGWSDLAKEICLMFNGSMVEVSQSGKALHIWGKASSFPAHKCKNTQLHLEMYHTRRFIMLGSHAQGDPNLDQTAALSAFIAKYMPNQLGMTPNDFNWTTEPVPEWHGPTDDAELIKVAFEAKSLANVFGGSKMSFKDLWEANAGILSQQWPHASNGYDASSADMSLAQRLAYWTGKDCQRIERLMRCSGLVRDKWDQRADYLRRTILTACAAQTRVYSNKRQGVDGVSRKFAGGWVSNEDIPEIFAGCIYVIHDHVAVTPDGQRLTPEKFRVMFGGFKFAMDDQRSTRNAWEAFTECPSWRPPIATGVCFRPELPPLQLVEEGEELLLNLYRPIETPRMPGDVSRVTKLIDTLYPNDADAEILRTYMAACTQHIGTKFQWCPLLQGPEGNGKTFLISCLENAIGHRHCHTLKADEIAGNGGRFNAWLFGKAFVAIEEIRVGNKHEMMEILKPMLTNTRMPMEAKGKDQFTGDNRANFMMTSNYTDALILKDGDRRYSPLGCAPQSPEEMVRVGLTPEFFSDLWDWAKGVGKYTGQTPGWAYITDWLKSYKLDVRFNPAGGCVRAPRSSMHNTFVANSLGRAEQEVLEAIEQGRSGFAGGWVSSTALDAVLESRQLGRHISHNRRKEILKEFGYVSHPALKDGRATRPCLPDNAKARLYLQAGHEALAITDAAKVVDAYNAAQLAFIQELGPNVIPLRKA